ncbi:MAG: ABC transporter ATP-binding protein [Pirellulales bacterium]
MNDPVISVTDLSRRFGRNQALDCVRLNVRPGIVFGLVGENGAGKTTLIKHLLGLLKAEHGTVRVLGHDPVRDPVAVLGNVGYLSEERDLPDRMTIGQLMRYQQAFYPRWDETYAQELCETFRLDMGERIKHLSRGQRARTGLLVALAHRPKLLILDEPSSGLDPAVRRDILGAIVRTVADEGRNVLFSSHLLEEVQRVADEVAMLHHGRVVLNGTVEKILNNHHRITIRFDDPQQVAPDLPGTGYWIGERHEWTTICNGELETLKQAVAAAGARIVEEEQPSLDEVFLAQVSRQAGAEDEFSRATREP